MAGLISDVRDLEAEVFPQFPLHGEVVHLHDASLAIQWNAGGADASGQRKRAVGRNYRRSRQRRPLRERERQGCSGRCRDGLHEIDWEVVADLNAEEVRKVTTAVSSTHYGLWVQLIGDADARCEI